MPINSTPLLVAVHGVLTMGEEVTARIIANADTPEKQDTAEMIRLTVDAHAHVIRSLVEMQLEMMDHIETLVKTLDD